MKMYSAIKNASKHTHTRTRTHTHTHTRTQSLTLQGNVDRFTFIPSAEVETVGADHITEGNANDNTASVSEHFPCCDKPCHNGHHVKNA